MRLTAELINNSLSYLNPLKERELDLRGHKIPAIENLGVVAKDHECIDFTDNDISTLANFPLSPRLQTLLLARNRIASIQPSLTKSIPSLSTLVLTQNNIAELADLDPLQGFAKLTHVSLVENPVTSKEKVKDAERVKAKELFGTFEAPTELAQSIIAVRSRHPANVLAAPSVNGVGVGAKVKITEKERKRFEALVKKAKTLSEVQRLEKAFAEGRLPPGVAEDDIMDET